MHKKIIMYFFGIFVKIWSRFVKISLYIVNFTFTFQPLKLMEKPIQHCYNVCLYDHFAPWWHLYGTLMAPWWHPHGRMIAPWWPLMAHKCKSLEILADGSRKKKTLINVPEITSIYRLHTKNTHSVIVRFVWRGLNNSCDCLMYKNSLIL